MASELASSSTPTLQEYSPLEIPWQADLIFDVTNEFDYSLGVHQVLLSGTLGSGKSLPAAHLCVRHCLEYPGANVLIGRKTLPDLKKTFYQKVTDHLRGIPRGVVTSNRTTDAQIEFANGSKIIGYSWDDADWESFGSLELSMFVVEEATENSGKYREAYFRLLTRLGRQPHIPRNVGILLCNPDGPSHWIYEHFGLQLDEGVENPERHRADLKHVYYSLTRDNPFLPPSYVDNLARNLDPKLAERLLKGRWIDISEAKPYHAYLAARNFKDASYKISDQLPLRISWDFNIGEGKPLSAVVFQYDPERDHFHFFDESVVEGMRTIGSLEEIQAKGLLDKGLPVIVHGDATGKHKDTRSLHSDYDIIKKFLENYEDALGRRLAVQMQVTRGNPPIRDRQNLVNAYCVNALGEVRLTVWKDAPTVDKGLRSTKMKKGANLVEDDSDPWQHITSAVGYGIHQTTLFKRGIYATSKTVVI